MNLLPSFSIWQFAIAGAIFATGPLIIHLLNRRRFRVVHWAAMEFLLQAVKRNRRILQLRDLILLLLRTAAVLLFGLALAQPFLSEGDSEFNGTQPLHVVLVIDNSLSTGYQHLEGNLLDRTRQQARRFIDRLPQGSLISLVPLAGSQRESSVDPHASREHALAALDRIEVVDRAVSFRRAVNEAQRASQAAPNLAKRVVFFTDQQRGVWNDLQNIAADPTMPPMQIVNVAPDVRENSWIASLRVQDGLADVETPTTILVEVEHQGESPREDVLVSLFVDDVEVTAKAVNVEPGLGRREIAFEHIFGKHHPEPGRPAFVPVRVTLTPDRLPADDQRHLVVPVVTSLPVVFVDQFNNETEDVAINRIGETRHLRKLLAPSFGTRENQSHLIRVRHRSISQLDRDLLADARLVVVAGIADPGTKVGLLREYVQQGGQLVIAAGGSFNPSAWTSAAWQNAEGILPAPLLNQPLGTLPEQSGGPLKPFFLATENLESHPFFRLAGISESELRDLYSEPFFFQAVVADVSDELVERVRMAEMDRLRTTYPRPSERDGSKPPTDDPPTSDASQRWLLWESPTVAQDEDQVPAVPEEYQRWLESTATAGLPRVLARFTDADHTAYLVERSIGRGHVVFVSSGLLSNWNTIAQTNAMVLFDRLLRSMIESTLPQRNYDSPQQIALPLVTNDRAIAVSLTRPSREGIPESLDIGFIRRDQLGVTVGNPLQRGLYRIAARKRDETTGREDDDPDWELAVTVNGPASESDLRPLTDAQQAELAEHPRLTLLAEGEPINLAGAQTRGQDSWWWLIFAVLILLACEVAVLVLPVLFARRAPSATPSTLPSLPP
ncbi:MAG: BatA domain-containing protein [Pirellulaceae bacterium]|nr:hypothetical protein [Planctomycetaceae bacterium]MDP6554224.1 BatA domain-containing protein [Pirellulaceae bacterium]